MPWYWSNTCRRVAAPQANIHNGQCIVLYLVQYSDLSMVPAVGKRLKDSLEPREVGKSEGGWRVRPREKTCWWGTRCYDLCQKIKR